MEKKQLIITSCIEPMSAGPKNYLVPIVVDQNNGRERSYDIFSRLLKDNVIMLTSPIDAGIASIVTAQLLYLELEDPEKEINFYINSPGGSVSAGLAILDAMKYVSNPIITCCQGDCASMAAVLLAGGDRRVILPNSRVMIHQPLGEARGQASDIEIMAKEILRIRDSLNDLFVKFTGQDLETIKKDTNRDFWMTAEQAIEYGMVDELIPWKDKKSAAKTPSE